MDVFDVLARLRFARPASHRPPTCLTAPKAATSAMLLGHRLIARPSPSARCFLFGLGEPGDSTGPGSLIAVARTMGRLRQASGRRCVKDGGSRLPCHRHLNPSSFGPEGLHHGPEPRWRSCITGRSCLGKGIVPICDPQLRLSFFRET